jgi:hypothetical protein
MIVTLFLNIVIAVIGVIFMIIPTVTLASIPVFGQPITDILTSMIHMWNAFMVTFPYAQTAWHLILWVIIPFEIGLLVLKFFLGHRTPVNH